MARGGPGQARRTLEHSHSCSVHALTHLPFYLFWPSPAWTRPMHSTERNPLVLFCRLKCESHPEIPETLFEQTPGQPVCSWVGIQKSPSQINLKDKEQDLGFPALLQDMESRVWETPVATVPCAQYLTSVTLLSSSAL